MKSSILKAGWVPGLVLTLVFVLLFLLPTAPLQTIEYKTYDFAAKKSMLAAGEDIVIIGIDHASIRHYGSWPWPRGELARAVDKLTAAGIRLLVFDVLLEHSTYDPALERLASLQASSIEGQQILQQIRALNQDQQLVDAIRANGKVLMPMTLKAGNSNIDSLPASLTAWQLPQLAKGSEKTPVGGLLSYPYDDLTAAASGLGFDTILPERDAVLRSAPLVMRYGDAVLPSLALLATIRANGLEMNSVSQAKPGVLKVGALELAVDPGLRVYPRFHKGDGERAYRYVSFARLMADDFPLASLQNKIILFGFTDGAMATEADTPVAQAVSAIEFQADLLQSLLEQTLVKRPGWMKWTELGLLVVCGVFLMLALPRLHLLWGTIGTLVLAIVIAGAGIGLLLAKQIWLQTMGIALFLLIGLLAVTVWRLLTDVPVGGSTESAEQNKMMALTFQSQGMLDMAFDKLRLCPVNDDILNQLYNLSLDFERKRQLDKAGDVYEYILSHQSDFRDVRERLERLNQAMEGVATGTGSMGGGMDTLLVAGGAKPTLGRYEIVKELGKGAMGIVYLGRDPKINRYVAIKTMALNQEFEADDVEEVKARFFREAKTAGMLSHPNIVTMYDVGEEHDLAYIAMEYLDGSDLAPYTKKGKLFPPQATLKICGKVAEALHVAHAQSVIHRDIKPANIMLLKDKTVKVTDFGIARISAASKTKSGVVLGTPSYMSPEQLSGKHIDGRSDLFSLGVMMYEMLGGVRPFRGDSMATLMFQIANEPHPDIREHCEAATESLARLIDRMLAKDPEARIPNGAEVIRGIIQCLREMNR